MSGNNQPDSLTSSPDFVVYPTVGDAAAATPFATTRAVRCANAGTLVVKRALDNAEVALPFAAGETQMVQITGVVAAGSGGVGPITILR